MELANRIFFKLYQCANMLHKTGSRAVQDEGLTTQQWAVLGALSRPEAAQGMGVDASGIFIPKELRGGISRSRAERGSIKRL